MPGLTSLLTDDAPAAVKQYELKTLFGRRVAIDASMSLYQFLIAVRQSDGQQMMSDSGETTSHLLGFFYRTLRMVDYGIKPVYVFDGKPPDLKSEVVCWVASRGAAVLTRLRSSSSGLESAKRPGKRRSKTRISVWWHRSYTRRTNVA